MTTRRQFVRFFPAVGIALGLVGIVRAAELDTKDPQAAALGYVADATKTDKVKFPKYATGQICANCQLYQGKAGDVSGPCPLFAGKSVAASGWCSAYAKRA